MTRLIRLPRLKVIALLAVATLLSSCAAPSRLDDSGMTFSKEPLLGKVVWSDLVTEDLAAARRFYGQLLGWTFEDTTGPAGQKYVIARSGGTYVAGLVPVQTRADGVRLSRWLPYVSVADVDAALRQASTAGARIALAARDVGIGRVAVIIDPEGAVIGLARSSIGDPEDTATTPAAGRRVWTELVSNDPGKAAGFYGSVVGFQARTIERRGGEYTMLANNGTDRAGVLRNPTADWSPVWLTSFGVSDPAAAAMRAESLGGKVLLAPSSEVREGTMAIVADPSGALVVLQQVKT
jgi:predicted enzyme related to lactoylglutathione lyase